VHPTTTTVYSVYIRKLISNFKFQLKFLYATGAKIFRSAHPICFFKTR
jgi:hypothetical protein